MADLASAERTLPHNLEAERSILGAILIQNEAFNYAAQLVDARDFFRDAHRRIFEKMILLNERGSAIDLVTLKEALQQTRELDESGGPAYLASLADGVPRSANVEYYARIVKEKATLRGLIQASHQILQRAYDAAEDPDVQLDEAERAIFAIAEDRNRSGFVSMYELALDGMPKVEQLYEHKQLITGVDTGLHDLNQLTRGFQPSDLVIVAARPSMGKTSLVLNIAEHVAIRKGRTVGFFSLEMSKQQLFLRLLTSVARIDGQKLLTGTMGTHEFGRINNAVAEMGSAPLYIDDTPGMGVLEMRAKARRLAAERGLDLLVVDYIQLMTSRGRFDNRTLELGAISRGLKALAKELQVPVVVLSQLSRAPEARADHRPLLSDLRESGALEQDADVVLMLYRPDMYPDAKPEDEGLAELIIAKQRNGPTGLVRLSFLKQHTRFENYGGVAP